MRIVSRGVCSGVMAWEDLLAIRDEAITAAEDDAAAADDPDYCPISGTLLQVNSQGMKRCPFCGWEPR